MGDFVNKIISLILVFVICIVCPLTFLYLSSQKESERLILNKAKSTLDVFATKDTLSEEDLDNMYKELNAYGLIVDSKIEKYTMTSQGDYILDDIASAYEEMEYETNGIKNSLYLAKYGCGGYNNLKNIASNKYIHILNTGDVLKIHVKEVIDSTNTMFLRNILRTNEGGLEFSLAIMIE